MNVWGKMKKVTIGGMFVGAMMLVSSFSVTGCLTDDKKDDTTKVDTAKHTALGTATALNVGAQGHATYGSVIDIDSGKTWLSGVANANQAGIDLVFMFYGAAFHIDDAVSAKAAGTANAINLTNSYDDTKIVHVDFVKVTTKPADQQAAAAAFTAGTKIHTSAVVAGDMFIVKSTGGKIALVTVSSISGADKAAAAGFNLQVNTI